MYSSKPDDDNLPEVVPFSAPEVAPSNAPEVAPSNAPETLSPEDANHARNLEEPRAKYPVLADPTPLYYPVEKSDVSEGTVVSPLSPDEANALGGLDAALAGDGSSTATSPTLSRNEDAEAQDDKGDETKKERKYCGLSKRNLIIIIVVAVLVVAALAGGLGGGLAAKRTNTTGNANPEAVSGSDSASTDSPATTVFADTGSTDATASSTPTSSSSRSASSTSLIPTPTATVKVGDEDFSFDGWSAINYKDNETPTYKDTGFINLPFNVSSYFWNRGNTVCCLTFCQGNHTDVGYTCDSKAQPMSSAYFDRIYVWCDLNSKDRANMCSPS